MATATDQQVQQYVNERLRVRAEQTRAFLRSLLDDKASIDDVYAACTQATPTWKDSRADGPPHLLTTNDVLSYNSFITALIDAIQKSADYPVVAKACVRPV